MKKALYPHRNFARPIIPVQTGTGRRAGFNVAWIFIFFYCAIKSDICSAQAGEWTWMKGDSTVSTLAHYGIQGTFDSLNTPQGLYEAGQWKDSSGNFWLFGGVDVSLGSYQNALWKYDPVTNNWSWIAGSQACCQPGTYGTLGIPDPGNYPGSRKVPATWVDDQNYFWMFGGEGLSSNGTGDMNDLWKYDPLTNEWTWVSGSSESNQSALYGSIGVPDPSNVPGARHECVATWTDQNGNLWLFGGYGLSESGFGYLNDLWKYDPANNLWTWINGSNSPNQPGTYGSIGIPNNANSPGGRCSYAHWLNCTGNKLWLFGGFGFGASGSEGALDDLWQYDIANNWWTWVNGSNMIDYAGLYVTKCDSGASDSPQSRYETRACWTDKKGNFWMVGGSKSTAMYNDLWVYNANVNQWMWVSGQSADAPLGFYGIKGVGNPNNAPRGKVGGISWYDTDNILWYFGGGNYGASYNDLWKYEIDPSCTFSSTCYSNNITYFAANTKLCEKFCTSFFDQSLNNPTAWQWSFPGGVPSSSADQNPDNICYTVPGIYDVTLITTNASGNDTLTLYNYITVYSTPPFPVITQASYTLTSSPAYSYQWQLNAVDIPGATNQSYNVLQTGLYTVIAGDSNGCVNSANKYVLIIGIADVMDNADILIYPNPSSGSFTIEWANAPMVGGVVIEVVNTLGQKVFSTLNKIYFPSFKKEINLGDVARGVYFIQIKTKNSIVTKKIIITK